MWKNEEGQKTSSTSHFNLAIFSQNGNLFSLLSGCMGLAFPTACGTRRRGPCCRSRAAAEDRIPTRRPPNGAIRGKGRHLVPLGKATEEGITGGSNFCGLFHDRMDKTMDPSYRSLLHTWKCASHTPEASNAPIRRHAQVREPLPCTFVPGEAGGS
jgi:hypothetical protein